MVRSAWWGPKVSERASSRPFNVTGPGSRTRDCEKASPLAVWSRIRHEKCRMKRAMANLDVARKTLPLAAASWQSLDQKEHRAQGKIINNGASLCSSVRRTKKLSAFSSLFIVSSRQANEDTESRRAVRVGVSNYNCQGTTLFLLLDENPHQKNSDARVVCAHPNSGHIHVRRLSIASPL